MSQRVVREPIQRRVHIFFVTLLGVVLVGTFVVVNLWKAPRTEPAAEAAPTSTSATTDPTTAAAPTSTAPAAQITLAFAGDVHFTGRTEGFVDDPATAFGPISATLSAADLTIVNLETAITEGGTPEPKEYHFRAPATAFDALRAAGIDVASMANNHGVDYGQDGLTDTLNAITQTGFPTVGIGANAEQAYAPYIAEVNGVKVAVIGASQVEDNTFRNWTATDTSGGIASTMDTDRLLASVAAARAAADVVVVYMHWGIEGDACPSAEMQTLSSDLAAAGADAVLGTHAHLLLGAGYKGQTYVAYGLANFLWWLNAAYSDDTGVITLTMQGRQVVSAVFTPALIDGDGRPQPISPEESAEKVAAFDALRECTDLSPTPGV